MECMINEEIESEHIMENNNSNANSNTNSDEQQEMLTDEEIQLMIDNYKKYQLSSSYIESSALEDINDDNKINEEVIIDTKNNDIDESINEINNYSDTVNWISDRMQINNMSEKYQNLYYVMKCRKNIDFMKLPKVSNINIHTKSAKCLFSLNRIKGIKDISIKIDVILLKKIQNFANQVRDNIINNIDNGENTDYQFVGVKYYDDDNDESVDFQASTIPRKKKRSKKNKQNDEPQYTKTGKLKKKKFANQVTFKIKPGPDRRLINIKLFKNFNSTMTGVLHNEDGIDAVEILKNEIIHYKDIFGGIIIDDNDISANNYSTCMIVATFHINIPIDRTILKDIILRNYDIFAFYDPDADYQGVIIHYKWNINNKEKDGKCHCVKPCTHKKGGDGFKKCRKVTIAVFQAGTVLITGATNTDQLIDARKFIVRFLRKNWKDVININISNYKECIPYFPEGMILE